jgi:hypothetical protein
MAVGRGFAGKKTLFAPLWQRPLFARSTVSYSHL